MNSIIIPVSNPQIVFVKIGDYFRQPSIFEMEDVKTWIEDHKESWFSRRKELSAIFGFKIKVKIFPFNLNNKYVWMISDNYWFSELDIKAWTEVFNQANEDPECILFVWGGYSIKLLNKFLIPFL